MTKLVACKVLMLNHTIQWQRRNDNYMLVPESKTKTHSLLKPLLHITCLDAVLLPHIIFWSKYIFKLASKVQHPSRFVDIFPTLWVFPRQQNFRRTKHSLWKTDGNVDQVNSESKNQKKMATCTQMLITQWYCQGWTWYSLGVTCKVGDDIIGIIIPTSQKWLQLKDQKSKCVTLHSKPK